MKLHVKKDQLHKDVGKAPGAKITEADNAKEKSKGGIYAKRAQFAENAKKWNHPGKGRRYPCRTALRYRVQSAGDAQSFCNVCSSWLSQARDIASHNTDGPHTQPMPVHYACL
jgi:hypothetical protein